MRRQVGRTRSARQTISRRICRTLRERIGGCINCHNVCLWNDEGGNGAVS
jgi:hypothetical protein